MAMETTAIRFDATEKSWIQAYADFVGKSFSEVVREATLEMIEDVADQQAYEEAIAKDDGVRYSTDQVLRMVMEVE